MIPAKFYYLIYLVLVTILTISLTMDYSRKSNRRLLGERRNSDIAGWSLAILLAVFIGTRPVNGKYFVDMANYNSEYYALAYGKYYEFSLDQSNFIFHNLFYYLGSLQIDVKVFFVLMAALYFMGMFAALRRMFPNDALLAFIVYLGAFSTFSYGTNGLKAGVAASIFLCAIAYADRRWLSALLLLVSWGFHHSMFLPIGAFIAAKIYNNSRAYFGFWVFCLIVAALHITYFQELFGSLTSDEQAAGYLNRDIEDDWGGKTGFRWDFIAYSSLPILVGYYTLFRRGIRLAGYQFILNIYLFVNGFWMLCMYMPFNNRVAYLSWCLYPVLTIYPYLHTDVIQRQVSQLNQVVWIQLLFTLAMYFV